MFYRLILFSMIALAPGSALAETLPGPIPADIVRIVDGDTIRVRAHIWPDQTIEVMVRIHGIDTPEIHRPHCSAERALAEEAKNEVTAITGDTLFLHNVHFGKYAGRVVADAHLPNGINLAEHLLQKGLALRENDEDIWCKDAGSKTVTSRP